jgi:hypothetical protein
VVREDTAQVVVQPAPRAPWQGNRHGNRQTHPGMVSVLGAAASQLCCTAATAATSLQYVRESIGGSLGPESQWMAGGSEKMACQESGR